VSAAVSLRTVLALSPALSLGIVAVVPAAIGTSYGISRMLCLRQRMAILVACGNSAITALAPVIDADRDHIGPRSPFMHASISPGPPWDRNLLSLRFPLLYNKREGLLSRL